MKKKWWIFLVMAVSVATGTSWAQEEEEDEEDYDNFGGRFVCDEPSFDFGLLECNGTVEHDFLIRNEGSDPLEIQNVWRSDRGCYIVSISSRATEFPLVLSSGENISIRVALDLTKRNWKGHQDAEIMLEHNTPGNFISSLHITGETKRDITLYPSGLYLGRISTHESYLNQVQIFSKAGDFQILSIHPSRPEIVVQESPDGGKSQDRRTLSITL